MRAARFYNPKTGFAEYEIACTSKTGNRPVTIRDAKRLSWVPSVTTILSVIAKPFLEKWKLTNLALAMSTLPREHGESQESFVERAISDSETISENAADLGRRVHKEIENFLEGKPGDPELQIYLDAYEKWHSENISEVLKIEEVVIAGDYAGRCDMVAKDKNGHIMVIDFKTQNVKNGKPVYYDEWPLQLIAYAKTMPHDMIASIVLSTSEPGKLYSTAYHDIDRYLQGWEAAKTLWYYQNWPEKLEGMK